MTPMSTIYYYESYKSTMRMIKKYIENCVPILNLGCVPILNLGLAYNLQSSPKHTRDLSGPPWTQPDQKNHLHGQPTTRMVTLD